MLNIGKNPAWEDRSWTHSTLAQTVSSVLIESETPHLQEAAMPGSYKELFENTEVVVRKLKRDCEEILICISQAQPNVLGLQIGL